MNAENETQKTQRTRTAWTKVIQMKKTLILGTLLTPMATYAEPTKAGFFLNQQAQTVQSAVQPSDSLTIILLIVAAFIIWHGMRS